MNGVAKLFEWWTLEHYMAEELPVDWMAIRDAAIAGVPFRALAIQFGLFTKAGKPNTNAIRQRSFRERWPVVTKIVYHAKKKAREHNQAQEALRKARANLNPSLQNPTHITPENHRGIRVEIRSSEEIEPGLEEPGFMGESSIQASKELDSGAIAPKNQGSRVAGSVDSGVNQGNLVPLNGGIGVDGGAIDASDSLNPPDLSAATVIASHMQQVASNSMLLALQRAALSIEQSPASLPIATLQDLRTALAITMQASGMDKTQNNTQLNILVSPTPKQGTWNFHDSPESLTIDAE